MIRRLAALLLLVPLRASAGGFSIADPDAAALGRAGTAAALPDGPSASYYNPAGLTLGRGLSLQAGFSIEHDRLAVTVAGATSRTRTTVPLPSLFVSQRLGDHFGVGLGLYRAPGQSLDYGDAFPGRFRVQRASFGGTTLAPSVAGRPFSFLSIGFGLTVTFGELDIAQAHGDASYETRLSVQGKAVGLGGTIGVWARLYRDFLTFGWSYRSAFDLDHSGRARTTLPGSETTLAVEESRLSLPMPHLFTFALGSRPRRGTAVSVEARLGLLRDFDGLYLKDTAEPPATLLSFAFQPRELVQLRCGFEQKLIGDRLALRIGVGYDLGSARRDLDPAFPDGDRVIIAAGLGYGRPDFAIDAGYLASFSPGATGSRGLAYAAEYVAARHSIGLSLSVRVPTVGPRPTSFD